MCSNLLWNLVLQNILEHTNHLIDGLIIEKNLLKYNIYKILIDLQKLIYKWIEINLKFVVT